MSAPAQPTLEPPFPGLASSAAPEGPPPDCEALAERARDGGPDAVLLAWLCPERPMDPLVARAALREVRSPDEAAALAPRLADHPGLQGLARLVAQPRVTATAEPLPAPAHAVVSPIDDAVLAHVQQAHGMVHDRGTSLADRTRARAYLAKVYLQATQQLGVSPDRPPSPFERLLVGRALAYGRSFGLAYWHDRVGGLAPLFAEVESRLLELHLTLERGPSVGDTGRLAVELTQSRRHLLREGPRGRIEQRLGDRAVEWSFDRLESPPDAIERLTELGLVDLAIADAIELGRAADGPGLGTVEQRLRDTLTGTERDEYLALLEHRFARARARTPAPPEDGPGHLPPHRTAPWPGADAVADEAAQWIERAPQRGFERGYALGRALLLLRSRPDALLRVLDRATEPEASAALRAAVPWLHEELAARDDGRIGWQARRVAADAIQAPTGRDEQEAARRRAAALVPRRDGRSPRGAGLLDRSG